MCVCVCALLRTSRHWSPLLVNAVMPRLFEMSMLGHMALRSSSVATELAVLVDVVLPCTRRNRAYYR